MISRSIDSDDGLVWFHICGQNVCLTPSDFALVTGLRFGASSFDTTAVHDVSGVDAYNAFCVPGRSISIPELVRRITSTNNGVDDPDGSLHLRAALVCVAHSIVCGSDKNVEPWMWALVHDERAFNDFPWGAYSYQVMVKCEFLFLAVTNITVQ
mgnify:CR=1 FL=1